MQLNSIRGCLVLAAIVASASGAQAQQPRSSTLAGTRAAIRCSQRPLQSAGYRDMLARFPSRQLTRDANAAARFFPSYRDATNRYPAAAGPKHGRSLGSPPRYVLRVAVSCG